MISLELLFAESHWVGEGNQPEILCVDHFYEELPGVFCQWEYAVTCAH